MSAVSIPSFHKDLIVVDHAKLDAMSQGDLVELAKDINGKAIKAAKQTLIHAGQTGIVLIALKEKVPHGQFLKYVESMTEIPPRTAQTYMSIAVNYATVAHLRGVRDAIRYIRDSSARANRITESESVTLPPPPRQPSPPVTLEAEIVEPAAIKLPAKQQSEAWERAQEIASGEDRLPLDDQKTAAILEPQEFYGIILSMLPHLTKSEIKSLIETLNTRWT